MRVSNPALQSLLDVLEQPRSGAVLGAGASAGLVPFGKQFSTAVRRRVLACGVYPVQPVTRDIVSDRILGPPNTRIAPWDDGAQIEEELVAEHLFPAAVRAAAVALLSPSWYQHAPPQYLIFNLARYPLAIINYNHDGLADLHCLGHTIVSVHGKTLNVATREELDWESWIDALQELGVEGPDIPRLFLPQPETWDMASTSEYARVRRLLQQTQRIALVGYSFGGGDDWVGLSYVRAWLRAPNASLVVVNPDAANLTEQIAQEFRSLSVLPLPMYWDVLACAVIGSRSRPRRRACDHQRHCARCIAYLYEAFLDSGRDWGGLCERYALTPPFAAAELAATSRVH